MAKLRDPPFARFGAGRLKSRWGAWTVSTGLGWASHQAIHRPWAHTPECPAAAQQIAPSSSAACGPVELSTSARHRPQDTIKGSVVVNGRGHSLTHEGISLHAEGQVSV